MSGAALCVLGVLAAFPGAVRSAPPPAESPPVELRIAYVDGAAGMDSPDRDGAEALPWRTVTYALGRIEGSLDPEAPQSTCVEIWLAPGLYEDRRGGDGEGGEVFPWRPPLGATQLRIGALEGSEPVVIASSSPQTPILEIVELGPPEPEVPTDPGGLCSLEGLVFRGGWAGVSTLVPAGGHGRLRLAGCSFQGQVAAAVEGWVAPGGGLEAEVARCWFQRCGGGVSIEAADSAQVDLFVVESHLEGLSAYGPGFLLGAGVDLHLDPGGRVDVLVERCTFRSAASALQLTGSQRVSDADPQGGAVRATFAGNLVVGARRVPSVPGAPTGSDPASRGLYLSLEPHHDVELLVASNTFVGLTGPVVFHDNLEALLAAGRVIPFAFVHNICHDTQAAGELSVESILDDLSPDEAARIDVRRNLLEQSRFLQSGGNRAGDPGFVDAQGGDYRLRPDSPAVDAGGEDFSRRLRYDLDGRCRRTSQVCSLGVETYPVDLGAYERPGICDEEVASFRRGDCNDDGGAVEISDAISVFGFLFLGAKEPSVLDACDSNDDGVVDITDGIHILTFLFAEGSPPLAPFESAGSDPTRDCLPSA